MKYEMLCDKKCGLSGAGPVVELTEGQVVEAAPGSWLAKNLAAWAEQDPPGCKLLKEKKATKKAPKPDPEPPVEPPAE